MTRQIDGRMSNPASSDNSPLGQRGPLTSHGLGWTGPAAGLALGLMAFSGCSGGNTETPTPDASETPQVTATPQPVTPTATAVPTPEVTPTATQVPEPTPTLEEIVRSELDTGRWTTDNYEKLVEFLVKYAEENPSRPVQAPFAVFDADKTMWGGDQGEAPFAHMLRNLKFDASLPTALPLKVSVPAAGLGVPDGGFIFASYRVQEAANAMLAEYQANVDANATMQSFLDAFSESMVQSGGVLAANETFKNAYQVYMGTLLALYLQLDANVGPVGFDFSTATDASGKYSETIHQFYNYETTDGAKKLSSYYQDVTGDGTKDILFPTIKDGTDNQLAYQSGAEVGAYAQVAIWEALGKTPAELDTMGAYVFNTYGLGQKLTVVVPVDAPTATDAAPLNFAITSSAFTAGTSPVEGVTIGTTALDYGNAVRDEIVNLMDVMRTHGITPVVVSASQTDLVASVAVPVYGVDANYVIGIQSRLSDAIYENWLLNPVTYRPGKVDAVNILAEEITGDAESLPVFCAGDSNTDFEFVAYSSDYRLFFDRAKVPLMELATWLTNNGYSASTVIQPPFEQ